MDQPQVDVVDAEVRETLLDRRPDACRIAGKLGSDEQLVTSNLAIQKRLTNLALVSIYGCRVDVAVAHLEGSQYRVASSIALNLPGPESDGRYPSAASCRDTAGFSVLRRVHVAHPT